MNAQELEPWAADLEAFHARFAPLFGRREPRDQAIKYVRGLLAPLSRKNGWQIAEAVGDQSPDRTQRLLYQVDWDADAARDILQQFVIERFGAEEGIGVVDETGFLKKGTHSVGVQRQYSGTAGRIENGQIGTFLSYARPAGHVFLDRRLYLPHEWCDDPERRRQAQVPPDVVFQTKPAQAITMLQHAWAQGVPMRWVTGDEIYGNSSDLREAVAAQGKWYVLAVRADLYVWREGPVIDAVQRGSPTAVPLNALVAAWPDRQWQRVVVCEGEKGPLIYEWACARVLESRDRWPGPESWVVARRSVSDPTEVAYYLSNAPDDIPLLKLAHVATTRYTIEQCFEEGKGEAGLDEYEVRYWHSWYRHITLSLMAHTWLASIRTQTVKKGAPNLSWPK